MAEKRRFIYEFDAPEASGFRLEAGEEAALRLAQGEEDSLILLGNAEGFLALARALVLLAQPEAGKLGASLSLDRIIPGSEEGRAFAFHRNDRLSEWPAPSPQKKGRVTDILRDQGLVREEDAYALLLKSVGERPLSVYTVLRSKLGMPSEEVVRIGDNAPMVLKTYRELAGAQSDADEIGRAGGVAMAAYWGRKSASGG